MKKNLILIAASSTFFLFCCNRNNTADSSIAVVDGSKATFKTQTELLAISDNKEHYTVHAEKGEQITTQNGTRILIAPGTFVTSSGTPVEGTVNVAYKSINTIEEIVASGIPMQANNHGEIGQFVSDGMFEISATANGEIVQVAEGKQIQVYTKSRDKESAFKYWYFDKTKGVWNETGTRDVLANDQTISENTRRLGIAGNTGLTAGNFRWIKRSAHPFIMEAAILENQEIVPNKMIPGKYDSKKMTLDISFDAKNYPDLADYSSLMWQFAGTDPRMDPARNNWIFQSAWNNVKLEPIPEKPGYFNLSLYAGGQPFNTIVRPVVSGKDLEKAQSEYADELQKIEQKQKQIAQQGASEEQITNNMYNAFNVSRMGVYNCDRFYNDAQSAEYTATFELEGKPLDPDRMIYILMDNRTGVIQYTSKYYKMRFNPQKMDAIFTVAANGAIAAANAATLGAMREKNGGKVHMVFEKVQVKINSLGSLKQAIESL